MSQNLDRETRLAALVLTADRNDPRCALRRAGDAAKLIRDGVNLYDVASHFGFTAGEAVGIMRGWDRASGKTALPDPRFARVCGYVIQDEDVVAGERIGAKMHALAGGDP